MRFSTLASAALFALASAQPQDSYAAGAVAADSSVVTTWTMTRTLERVVETVTATRNASAPLTTADAVTPTTFVSPPLGTASMGVYPQGNDTSSAMGTGAIPAPTGFPESGAQKVGLEMVALMAVVGLVGLVGL